MEERIVQFIAALRAGGVRVSLAESADAFLAIQEMGVKDRESFRLALRATLVKDASGIPVFEELFPLFFGLDQSPVLNNIEQDLTPEEADLIAQALKDFNAKLRQLLARLMRGEQLSQPELDALGRMVGLQNMDDLRYRDWMARRMQQALGFQQVQQALKELAETLAALGMDAGRIEQLRQMIQANQQGLAEQIRQYAGQQIAENMGQRSPDANVDDLFNRPFNALSDREMDLLRKQVQRLAALLRSRVALRQKRAKSGQLDAKATLRANLKHQSVPLEIRHRDHHQKPKLVIICDVSTSMRYCSELMLSLIYALQDQVSKTSAFAFISHLEFISPDFSNRQSNEAVRHVLDKMPAGYYNTDLGYSLENFLENYYDLLDNRSTLIVVGDGRNNFNNPRLEIFQNMTRRARKTIWLNPEPPVQWGSGDSDMLKYSGYCDHVLQVRSLGELAAAIDRLLV